MNIVDKLIIELGFDPTEFRKGTTETTKQVDTLGRKVTAVNESMGKSITDLANKFAVAFLGWRGLQEAIATNRLETQMRLTAENTGVAIEDVNAFSEVLRVKYGAAANDAAAALRKISEAQTEMRTTDLNAGWKVALSRFPADKFHGLLEDLNKARSPLQVMLDIADSLQEVAKGPGGRPDAFNLGVQLGLPESAINEAIDKGRAGLEKDLAFQKKRFKLTPQMAAQSQKTAESFRQLEITGEHALMRLMDKLQPFITQLTQWLDKIANSPAALTAAADGLTALANGIQFFVDVVRLAVQGWSDIMNTDFGKAMREMFGDMAAQVHEFVNAKNGNGKATKGSLGTNLFEMLHPEEGTARGELLNRAGINALGQFIDSLYPINPAYLAARTGAAATGGAKIEIGHVTVNSQAGNGRQLADDFLSGIARPIQQQPGPWRDVVKQVNQHSGSGS